MNEAVFVSLLYMSLPESDLVLQQIMKHAKLRSKCRYGFMYFIKRKAVGWMNISASFASFLVKKGRKCGRSYFYIPVGGARA